MTLCLRRNDLDWRELEDEIVALDSQGAVYLAVNGAGVDLWRLLADSTTKNRLVEALVGEYGIDTDQAAGDVNAFLHTLTEHGLVVSS